MAKVVICAQIDLPAEKREEALKTAQPFIDGALSQDGCIRYDWSADLNDPTRINVYEEWESQDALSNHFANKHYAGMLGHLSSFGIDNAVSKKFLVSAETTVYGEDGKPSAQFG
ncbi:MAG: putative quinol monooxygenase [Erythrobacter sp.]